MVPSNIQIQAAFRSFASIKGWHDPHAVTLTLKQGQQIDAGRGPMFVPLTHELASANMTHFLNRLNKVVFGSASVRYGKKVPVIPIIEGGNGKRIHYHLVLDCPRDDLHDRYPSLIDEIWQKTDWGYKKSDVTPKSDDGWTKYISKLRISQNSRIRSIGPTITHHPSSETSF
jgi:hypothetical protein